MGMEIHAGARVRTETPVIDESSGHRPKPLGQPFAPTAYSGGGRPPPKLGDILQELALGSRRLPPPGSPAFQAMVDVVRADLDPNGGPGFSTQDVSAAFSPTTCDTLFERLPLNSQADLRGNRYLAIPERHVWKSLPGIGARAFDGFRDWVIELIGEALGETIEVDLAQLRMCGADGSMECTRFARRHVDGGEFAVLVTLVGTGTEVLGDTPDFDHQTPLTEWAETYARTDACNVEPRHMVIITGTKRSKQLENVVATVHASPEHREDRMLLLLRLSTKPRS